MADVEKAAMHHAEDDEQPLLAFHHATTLHTPTTPLPALAPAAQNQRPRPFPTHMKAYYVYQLSFASLLTVKLCGPGGKDDVLYTVEMVSGCRSRAPLGARPGLLLRDGHGHSRRCHHNASASSLKSNNNLYNTPCRHQGGAGPVLAAAGDDAAVACTFNLSSLVLMPAHAMLPSPPCSPSGRSAALVVDLEALPGMLGAGAGPVTELMRASTSAGGGVVFRFAVEVGNPAYPRSGEKTTMPLRREQFAWCKVFCADSWRGRNGSECEATKVAGGFKLVRLAEGAVDEHDGETVAVLGWSGALSLREAFSLELRGSGASGALGDRWALMVVTTALRLWVLRVSGRTSRTAIAIGEKIERRKLFR